MAGMVQSYATNDVEEVEREEDEPRGHLNSFLFARLSLFAILASLFSRSEK